MQQVHEGECEPAALGSIIYTKRWMIDGNALLEAAGDHRTSIL